MVNDASVVVSIAFLTELCTETTPNAKNVFFLWHIFEVFSVQKSVHRQEEEREG